MDKGKQRRWGRKGTVILVVVITALATPACQDGLLPDAGMAQLLLSHSGRLVQEGKVTVRDGDEVQVLFPKPFQSPPRLEIVGFDQSWFKDVPYSKADFQIVQLQATHFTIRSTHGEEQRGAWAALKWRAEGTRAAEKPAASRTRPEQIIAWVTRAGGRITTDQRQPNRPITGIDVHQSRTTDADLELLPGLTTLRDLNLYGTKITDAGLVHLAGVTSLQALHLNSTAITNAGLANLRGLSNLTELGLGHTRVSDEGLPALARLTNLHTLHLEGTQVTDRGLEYLKKLTGLKHLFVPKAGVSPAGVQELQQALPKAKIFRS
jgi:hypothetical protein